VNTISGIIKGFDVIVDVLLIGGFVKITLTGIHSFFSGRFEDSAGKERR
jgi:hypothetical protein